MKNQYSFSRIKTFEECPLKFRYRYVDELPQMATEAMTFGKNIHEAVATALEGKPDFSHFDSDQMNEVKQMVQTAVDYVGERTVVSCEKPFGVTKLFQPFPFSDAYYRGIVDAVVFSPDTGMEIIDFKTNGINYSKDQLLLYALLAGTEFNVLPEKITYLSLRFGKVQTWKIDFMELVEFKENLAKRVSRIENETEFKPNPGEHCSFCSYIHKCPTAKMLEIPRITDDKSAIQQLKLAEAHSAIASSLKKTAQAYVKKSGESLVDGDNVFGPVESQAVSIKDEEALLRKLAQEGYNTETLRKLDTKSLKSIPGLIEKFGDWLKITNRTTYKWQKINKERIKMMQNNNRNVA